MSREPCIVFASGGGSGAEKLVEAMRSGTLSADIRAFACNKPRGSAGIWDRGERLGIPVVHITDHSGASYERLMEEWGAYYALLSGYLVNVPISMEPGQRGLLPHRTVNIHPGPLPDFGGKGMYGHHVHEAVVAAFRRGEVTHSAVTMHFVTPAYDRGPKIFVYPVPMDHRDDAESLGVRVNQFEHEWQAPITHMVLTEQISWTGRKQDPVRFPPGYIWHP
jgi:phosphoribosylglycinamide formyltransferase-1